VSKPKILTLDIETAPATAYVWRVYDENIGYEQIIEPGRVLCWAARFLGEKEMHFRSEWDDGRYAMLSGARQLLGQADAIVTYNGDKFDIPKLNGEFVLEGIDPPPPPTSIDVIKTVRQLGFTMNKLAHVGPLLQVGAKVKHEGFGLWAAVLEGEERALAKMERYNKQDVRLLERVYRKIRPFIRNHPHMGDTDSAACGACGSKNTQSRGTRRTKSFSIQRIQCQTCGSWSDGKRTKVRGKARAVAKGG
jgi:hypothetical protein